MAVKDVSLSYANDRHTTGLVKGGAIKLRGHLLGPEKAAMISNRKLRYFDDAKIPGYLQGFMIFDEGDQEGPLVSYPDNISSGGHEKDLTEGALSLSDSSVSSVSTQCSTRFLQALAQSFSMPVGPMSSFI